ncbi:MAG: winged helix-turn-helix transcriptional regulator [Candidatus Omnitrophica bacterium]|nr:winged helix-turn-helix transcriptional regulator [Candidatus Omnitrophota bacterium]
MKIRKARQILKSFADDNRIRIISLLNKEPLNVTELCDIIGTAQSNMSKHLARLRLTGVVRDKREGFNVYYKLTQPGNKDLSRFVSKIVQSLSRIEVTRHDLDKLRKIKGNRQEQLNKKKEVKNG